MFIRGLQSGSLIRFSECACTGRALTLVVSGLLVMAAPSVLQGQNTAALSPNWTVGVAGGLYYYEPSADEGFPIYVARASRAVSKWARFELGASYTRPEIQTDGAGMYDPSLPAEYTNIFAVTLGVQFKWTVGRLEPYGGISAGFYGRYDGDPSPPGRNFGRSTFQFPLGLRLWATDHIGVRGEYRFDEDRHEAVTHSSSEWTAGVFWTF